VNQIASVRDTLGRLPGPILDPARRDRLRQQFSVQRSKPWSTPWWFRRWRRRASPTEGANGCLHIGDTSTHAHSSPWIACGRACR